MVLAIPLAALIGNFFFDLAVTRQQRQTRLEIQHSQEVLSEIRRMTVDTLSAETGVRGYLLTKRRDFLEPNYTVGKTNWLSSTAHLSDLAKEKPVQVARAQRAGALAASAFEKLSLLVQTLGNHSEDSFAPIDTTAVLMEARDAIKSLRSELDDMEIEEEQTLNNWLAVADRADRSTLMVYAGSAASGLVGGTLAVLLFSRGIVRRIQRLKENTLRLAGRQPLLPLPLAEDEIGSLARGLEDANQQLRMDNAARVQAETLLYAHVRQQQAIAELGRRALGEHQDVDTLLGETVSLIKDTLNVELSGVLEHLSERGEFRLRTGLDEHAARTGIRTMSDDARFSAGYVLRAGRPVIIVDSAQEQRFRLTPWLEEAGVRSGVGVTVGDDGSGTSPFGVLCAYSLQLREFTPEEVLFLQSIANVLATAIVRHRGEEALRVVEARYQRIAANTPGMVYQFVLRPDGTIHWPFISEGCREIYGVGPEEIHADPELTFRAVSPSELTAMRQAMERSAADLSPFEWEGSLLSNTSSPTKWIHAAARPERLPDGSVLWDGVTTNITPLKTVEQQLQNALGETRIARAQAERANAAKSEFLSRMSHELRTPLNAILGFGQLLELDAASTLEQEGVAHILRAGRHLLSLVDEVLDIARIDTGRISLNLEPIDVVPLVEECVAMIGRLAKERGVNCAVRTVGGGSLARVLGDRQRLRQVLINLLSNATKYNREGGQIIVECESFAKEGRLCLRVIDTGLGIAPEQYEQLFVPFERLGAERSEVEGTGLGLAISKRLIEAMGGTIGVESTPGTGSAFWLELPQAPSESSLQDAPPFPSPLPVQIQRKLAADPEEQPTATVLYVEDNPSNQQLVKKLFASYRPELRLLCAENGEVGLDMAHQHRPELILLDWQLPGMTGDVVLARLKAEPMVRDIPVVILTADVVAMRRAEVRLGAKDYLTKPFEMKEFLEVLDENLATVPTRPECDFPANDLHPVSI